MSEESLEKLGLRTLEDINTIILHSHDLLETLDNIVTLVAKRMGTDVCSIYLLEDDGETLILRATKGLARSSVGKISMKTSEGLSGLVVEQRGVVATDNAPAHPRYKYFKESREERFHSFLGIPLMQRKTPIGVIVVQTREARTFRHAEISTLSTIAYQISSIIINAKLLDSIREKEEQRAFFERELERVKRGAPAPGRSRAAKGSKKEPLTLHGSPVSQGFSQGKISIIARRSRQSSISFEEIRSIPDEMKRLHIALEKAKIETLYMEKRISQALSEDDAAIFHAHLMMLEDRGFISRIHDLIEKEYGAARAVREAVDHYITVFSNMEDPYLRERSADMEDIGRRILDCLDGTERNRVRLREKRIIIAEDILPSDMATLDPNKIAGIITERGDTNSHAAIMARSLGIPAVLGVEGLLKNVGVRDEVILDGNSGSIFINPDAKIRSEYHRLQQDFGVRRRELDDLREVPAVTQDGARVFLRANIGLVSDIRVAQTNGAEGVGLYRTEFPYMARTSFPDRQFQYRLYRKVLEGFAPQPVTIRTLDIGGDKGLPYFTFPHEDNPFMGWRSIRVSLERRDIFREQLAGILMASTYGRASIMFPMISDIEEIRTIREILKEVGEELDQEGVPYDRRIRLGIMVELPAAVQIADILVREVDFFSIGTNDLIQYTLAADRNNPKVKKYFDPYHPAVLGSINRVAEVALRAKKGVSLCGEMAADPLNAVLLLGMGITEFSLAAPAIPIVKQALRKVTLSQAQKIARTALSHESASAVRGYLDNLRLKLDL